MNIKTAREKSGLKQQECADAVGVTLRAWQGYEQGIREPKFEILCAIADLFNVTTDYLLGRQEAKPQPDSYKIIAAKAKMESQEQAALKKWLALDEKKRKMVLDIMADIIHEYENTETSPEKPQEKYIIQRAARCNPNPNASVVETIEITAEERKRYREMPLEDWDL